MKKFVSGILVFNLLLCLIPIETLAAGGAIANIDQSAGHAEASTYSSGADTKRVELKKYEYDGFGLVGLGFEFAARFDMDGLVHTRKENLSGLFDPYTNKEIIPCKYDFIDPFHEDLALVGKNNKFGFINRAGAEYIPCQYDYADDFCNGLAVVEKEGKYGFIDRMGAEVIPCQYDHAEFFSDDGLAAVEISGKYGFVDRTGNEVIPCRYDRVESFYDGWSIVGVSTEEKDTYGNVIYQYGVIDIAGNEVVPCQYRYMHYSLNSGTMNSVIIACVAGNGPEDINAKWAFFTPETWSPILCDYDLVTSTDSQLHSRFYLFLQFSHGLAMVSKNGKYGYIDRAGAEVIPCEYDDADHFFESFAAVCKNGKWGYIDQAGNEIISFQYDDASSFSNGLAAVKLNGKWGYIDQAGREITPLQYDRAGPFLEDGYAEVVLNDEIVLIDRNNGYAPKNDFLIPDTDMKLVRRDGKVGLTDTEGTELIPCLYDAVYSWDQGTALVSLNGEYMFVDETGAKLETNIPIPTPFLYGENFFTEKWNWRGGFIFEYPNDPENRCSICTFTVTHIAAGGGGSGGGGSFSSDNEDVSENRKNKVEEPVTVLDGYIYNVKDPGADVILLASKLDKITSTSSAVDTVQRQVKSMTTEQKTSATGADLATLYAEATVSKAASKKVTGKEIIISKATVADLEAVAARTSAAVETALVNGGIATAHLVSNVVAFTTNETKEITIKIDPDILETQVDKIRVEAPTYAFTLKVADLKEDLTEIITITAQDIGSGFASGRKSKKTTVKVNLPKGKTTNPVTLSLPMDSGDTTYQTVVKTDGSATSSKYNPATTTMDGKINTSGSYTVQTNQKDFTDIANKSAEMQKAIRYLASKGIINGTSATEFSPDGSINRAEIAALLVRALGKLDNGATNTFTDVKSSDWYYSTAGSSQKCGLINGYTDNTFRGTTPIIKDQILAVAARVLKNEMGYKEPSDPNSYLAKYSDTVTKWAQPEVALATKENLVVYRVDGTFKGESNMTRGDAAIIIYRLFQKIW